MSLQGLPARAAPPRESRSVAEEGTDPRAHEHHIGALDGQRGPLRTGEVRSHYQICVWRAMIRAG